jgi:cell division protein ZapB
LILNEAEAELRPAEPADNYVPMDNQQFKALTSKVDDLIKVCTELDQENRRLKTEAINWQQEREQLIDKTEMARNKVESMITRLKSLEQ